MSSEDALSVEPGSAEKDRVYLINRVIGKRYEVLEFAGDGGMAQ